MYGRAPIGEITKEHVMPQTAIITADHEISKWDEALYGFLAEKQRRLRCGKRVLATEPAWSAS